MPKRKKLRAVRLTDIPLAVRCQAARQLADKVTQAERAELMAAALLPSDTRYWVLVEKEAA